MNQGEYHKLPEIITDISRNLKISENDVIDVFRSFVEKSKKRDLKIGVKYFQNRLQTIILDSIDYTERYYQLYYNYKNNL